MNEKRDSQQNGQDQKADRRKISDNVEEIVDEVNKTVRGAIVSGVDAAESISENLRDTIQGMRGNRENVVMVRVDKASLDRLDELVEAGIMNSRSEAAAFLIAEGIKARQPLFDRIAEKIQQIRDAKEELRRMVDEDET
ncbi:MAG: ribbon-helix-helix protein, CopG family [Chloroflexi bacterium]|nr:ribbon-helix-helix protein, CopG family [Chloroflexota bacterium]